MVKASETGAAAALIHVANRPDGYRVVYGGRVIDLPLSGRAVRGVARATLETEQAKLEEMERVAEEQRKLLERLRGDVERIEQEVGE